MNNYLICHNNVLYNKLLQVIDAYGGFVMASFMLGCNYWDSKSGTDMWKNWDENVIREDLSILETCGVGHLRVFPLWRDFQPVKKLYGGGNSFREYVVGDNDDSLENNPNGLDYKMIARFRKFAEIAKEHKMDLTVSIVTGWMSGRIFVPPALEGKKLCSDPEALMWTNKFVTGLVNELKDIDNIVMWDLGNECNNLGGFSDIMMPSPSHSRTAAYTWTALVANSIKVADNTRPIASGMHGLDMRDNGIWRLDDQGRFCDMMTTHPYPSPSIGADREPMNRMRTTIAPTAQSEYYRDLSGKPCMIQEQGSFSTIVGNYEMAAEFMRVNILSAWANNIKGYLWWCAMEHTHLNSTPYSWIPMERSLGLIYADGTPKPMGFEMRKIRDVLEKLPDITQKDIDAVCILAKTDEITYERDNSLGAYVLAKQAGFNIKFAKVETNLPISDVYILPGTATHKYIHKRTWDFLLDRVENHGAKLLITNNNAEFADFEQVFGLRSYGRVCGRTHTAIFSFGNIDYVSTKDVMLKSIGAEVLAENENGEVIFSRNRYGKGYVYYLGFPLEQYVASLENGFDPEINNKFYKVYELFAGELRENYILKSGSPYIGITQSKNEDGSYIVTAINYMDRIVKPEFCVKDGWEIEVIYGNLDKIDKCNAVVVKAYIK